MFIVQDTKLNLIKLSGVKFSPSFLHAKQFYYYEVYTETVFTTLHDPKVAKAQKSQRFYIQANFESTKHLHLNQTALETLKYQLSRCAFFVEKCIPFTNSAL
jgi:hypothetical protein